MQLALRVTTVGLIWLTTAASLAAEPAKTPGTAKPAPRVKVTISKETTVITSPLRPDGYPDYVAAVNDLARKGVGPEDNAVVPLVRGLGMEHMEKTARAKFFHMLGVAEMPPGGQGVVPLDKIDDRSKVPAEAAKVYEDQDQGMKRPWTAKEFPALAKWVERNEKPLALVVGASRKKRYYAPLVGDSVIAMLLPVATQSREAARLLLCRAMLRAGEDRIDDASQDLLACHRLARLTSQGPTLVESLVGITLDNMACQADAALARHPKATARQLKRFEADLRALPPLASIADKLDKPERYVYLDCVCMTARVGLSSVGRLTGEPTGDKKPLESFADAMADTLIDWDVVLRYGNPWYDRLVEIARDTDRTARRAGLAKYDQDLKRLAAEAKKAKSPLLAALAGKDLRAELSRKIGQIFIALMMPALGAVLESEDRGTMTFDVTRVALALGAYRAEHGRYPERLAALVPGYLPAVPKDLFSGGELLYRREGKGFAVYSVGPNGRDDGGQGRDLRTDDPASQEWDDIAVRVKGE